MPNTKEISAIFKRVNTINTIMNSGSPEPENLEKELNLLNEQLNRIIVGQRRWPTYNSNDRNLFFEFVRNPDRKSYELIILFDVYKRIGINIPLEDYLNSMRQEDGKVPLILNEHKLIVVFEEFKAKVNPIRIPLELHVGCHNIASAANKHKKFKDQVLGFIYPQNYQQLPYQRNPLNPNSINSPITIPL